MYTLSKYNFYIPYNNKVLYYNTLTTAGFQMTPIEHHRMQKQFEDLISFELEFPTVFQKFKLWGMIIDLGMDEACIMRSRHNALVYNRNDHFLSIDFTQCTDEELFVSSVCNYIDYLAATNHLTSLYLDGNFREVNFNFSTVELLNKISTHAAKICTSNAIPLQCQLNFNTIHPEVEVLHKIETKEFACFSITCNFKEETIEKKLELIKWITKARKQLCLTLIMEEESDANDLFSAIKCIPKKDRRLVEIRLKSKADNSTMANPMILEILDNGFCNPLLSKWRSENTPRVSRIIVNGASEIYLTDNYSRANSCGILNIDGEIIWNVNRRDSLLGNFWFENSLCKNCKYLPLLYSICVSRSTYVGSLYCMNCILKEDKIDPETLIIHSFNTEQKK